MDKQRAFIFIILGLVFSQFLVLNFNLYDGLEFHGFRFGIGSLLQFHFGHSEHKMLNTSVIGYLFFGIFLFKNLKNKNARASRLFEPTLIITALAIIFHFRNFVLDIMNDYSGQQLTIGIILFVMCLQVYRHAYDETQVN